MKNLRKKGSDRKWIALILLLLIAEVIWLFADLRWIQLPSFIKKLSSADSKQAGHVLSSKNDLKRRGVNSLIWEKAQENEILYYYDSVLTLSQSSAKLYLKDQTELLLSENTLVTLEEPEDKSKSEIRLRFSKGDFKARNPSARTSISGDHWYMNLEKGSEVQLRKEQSSYEFEVLSGQATLQTPEGTETLNDTSIIRFGTDQKINKIEKNQNLQWLEKKPVRIYVLDEQAQVPLQWTGQATKINISRTGEEENVTPVAPGQDSATLNLKPGSYTLRLGDANGLSSARTIEIWKAPHIILKKPLPRDRLKVGEDYEFVWSSEENVKEHQVQLQGKGNIRTESSSQNFKILRFDKEEDLEWKVEARDDEGFLIPALYQNKIFLREEPLQAPKLKSPMIQLPGTSGRFNWLKLFMSEAIAADRTNPNREILFEWEAVAGASSYTIEISSDPGFRKPEVIETVSSTEFIWKKFDPKKKFYWRVAAAGSSGKMGLFSEPIEVQPNYLTKTPQNEVVPLPAPPEKVLITKPEVSQEKPAPPAPVATPEPAPTSIAAIELPNIPSGWGIAWAPSYKILNLVGEANTKIQLSGGVPLGARIEFQSGLINNLHVYKFSLWGASQQWKPSPPSEFSIQENLNIPEAWLLISRENAFTNHSIGISLHQSLTLERKSEQAITHKTLLIPGFRYGVQFGGIRYGVHFGIGEYGLDVDFKRYFSGAGLYYGGAGHVTYQSQQAGRGFQGNLIFLLGFDRF